MTVRKKINAALLKFYKKLNSKVLTTLEEIEANTDSSNFAGATALEELNNNLTSRLIANSKQFYFDYQDGKYGYNTDPNRGADTFIPFKSGYDYELTNVGNTSGATRTATLAHNYSEMIACMVSMGGYNGGKVTFIAPNTIKFGQGSALAATLNTTVLFVGVKE